MGRPHGGEVCKIAAAGDVDRIVFSPDGSLLAARTDEGVVIYSMVDWTEVASFNIGGDRMFGAMIGFSPAGRRFVAAVDQGVRIWALDRGKSSLLLRHEKGWPQFQRS